MLQLLLIKDLRRFAFCRSGKLFSADQNSNTGSRISMVSEITRLYVTHHRLGGVDEPENDDIVDMRSGPGSSVPRIKVVSSAF